MLFNDSIKKHWLEKIEEFGDRFCPDCGESDKYLPFKAAPFCILTGIYNKVMWKDLEKEFQLPRWILSLVDYHMHNVSPLTSKEDLKNVIEACQTYQDHELLLHNFQAKMLVYCLENFSTIEAQLKRDVYFSPVWGLLLTAEQLKASRKEVPDKIVQQTYELQCQFEYWGEPSNKFNYFGRTVEATQKGFPEHWAEYLHKLHKLKREEVEWETVGQFVFESLIQTLKGI